MMSYLGQEEAIPNIQVPVQTTGAGPATASQTLTWLETQQQIMGNKVFTRKILPVVGQPYALHMSDDAVLKEVYSATPTTVKKTPEPEGTESDKLFQLRSGLEVPAEILKRDFDRKKAAVIEAQILENTKPSTLLQIGHFASQNPAQAAIIALAVGAIAGNIFFKIQH